MLFRSDEETTLKIQKFGPQLSRNLGTQLSAFVGKALGRSGQLPSFNFYDPGTRTPSNSHFQQPGSERKREEKKGKKKGKKKNEKK